jgi:hypothetical protein
MGALAFALPIGTIAVFSPSAFAKALPNPITCTNFGGTVTFGTPITKAGVPTASKLALNTTISGGVFNCTPGSGNGHNGPITILGRTPSWPKPIPATTRRSASSTSRGRRLSSSLLVGR